jgi:hypothetical protein
VRTDRGLSIRATAAEIAIDPTTLRRCEIGMSALSRSMQARIDSWARQ